MHDIVALGESLIDFSPEGRNDLGLPLYSQNPGGAPANVLAMASALGAKCALISKVGDDAFGRFLIDSYWKSGIDTRWVSTDKEHPTTLAFVTLSDDGDRDFSFLRKESADVMLCVDDIHSDALAEARIFHFGSVSMTSEPSRSATLYAARKAKGNGLIVSYDPNLRQMLWKSMDEAKEVITGAVGLADVLKVSKEEMELITGCDEVADGAGKLLALGPKIVVVTLGSEGSYFRSASHSLRSKAYDVSTVDTTGAGDAFVGAMLWYLSSRLHVSAPSDLFTLREDDIGEMMSYANAAGSLTTGAKGAIPAMPSLEAVRDCIQAKARL